MDQNNVSQPVRRSTVAILNNRCVQRGSEKKKEKRIPLITCSVAPCMWYVQNRSFSAHCGQNSQSICMIEKHLHL
jgi:hypothetical protein